MVSENVAIETLGQRLHSQATMMMARRVPSFSWLSQMAALLDHLDTLTATSVNRFARVESEGVPAGFPSVIDPRASVTPLNTMQARAVDDAVELPLTPVLPDRGLPDDVLVRLRRVTEIDASQMRVHEDAAADALARRHRAEAVTIGRDVHFRQGHFRPNDPDGFRLIAHEAAHVAERLTQDALWRRLTPGARRSEELKAGRSERRAALEEARYAHSAQPMSPFAAPLSEPSYLRRPSSRDTTERSGFTPPSAATPVSPTADTATSTSITPAPPPMAALEEREDYIPPPLDVEALQRNLLNELKLQLRAEFERGA